MGIFSRDERERDPDDVHPFRGAREDALRGPTNAAPPRKLAPSEVTEPGFYWASDPQSGSAPVMVEIDARADVLVTLEGAETQFNSLVARAFTDHWRILHSFDWFVGPLVPPEV